MPSAATHGRAYKEMTLQQLRSFCETARLGSLTAAAGFLGLAHPTVWKQVHALEREFGEKLVKPYGRGCRLTEAGQLLAELAGPAVANIGSLKRHFLEQRARVETRVTVATTPRILVEDLPACVVDFERRWPHVRLTFKELRDEEIAQAVESGDADLGFAPEGGPHTDSSWLVLEPCYELELFLVTPTDHPLARRRYVRPQDLCAYPLVNSPSAFHNAAVTRELDKLGAFRTQPRRVEAYFVATIRCYVELGFGIGLIPRAASHQPYPHLHERSMSRYFGRWAIYLVWRKGVRPPNAARAFADTVKVSLGRRQAPQPRKRRSGPGT